MNRTTGASSHGEMRDQGWLRVLGTTRAGAAAAIGSEALLDERDGLRGDGRIVTEAVEPVDVRFTTKPGQLAFGVMAVGLARRGDGFRDGQFTVKHVTRLTITKRVEGSLRLAVLANEAERFLDEAVREHALRALVDSLIELRSCGIETDAQDAIAGERVPPRLPDSGERPANGKTHLDGADELGMVVDMDALCGPRIEAPKYAVQPGRAAALGAVAQASPDVLGTLRSGKEAVEQGAQIEPCSASHDGKAMARNDLGNGLAGEARVVPRGAKLARRQHIDEVMRDLATLSGRRLGGADFHRPVNGDRVATDDLSAEVPAQGERQGCLTAAGGPKQDNEKRIHNDGAPAQSGIRLARCSVRVAKGAATSWSAAPQTCAELFGPAIRLAVWRDSRRGR